MHSLAISTYPVVNVILFIEHLGIQVNGHPFRSTRKVAKLKYVLQDERLSHLYAHYHLLSVEYVSLKVLDGLVTSVREQCNVREAGMPQISEQRLDASGVRDITGEGPVIYRHMVIQ